jgi:hypothetical protein
MGKDPVSVAFAPMLHTACVLNGGGFANIVCFHLNPKHGLTLLNDTMRNLTVSPVSAEPSSSSDTFGDIVFNPDETKLVVSQRGNLSKHRPGQIMVFNITNVSSAADGDFRLSSTYANAASDDCHLPSGLRFWPSRNYTLLNADMAYGVSISVLDGNSGMLNSSQTISVYEQREIGWAAWSNTSTAFFVTDKGNGSINEIHIYGNSIGEIVNVYSLPGDKPGTDLAIADTNRGEFIYVLAPKAGSVDVMKVNGPGDVVELQSFNVSKEVKDLPRHIQGMAFFIKTRGLPNRPVSAAEPTKSGHAKH